jgi:hypothetical protein
MLDGIIDIIKKQLSKKPEVAEQEEQIQKPTEEDLDISGRIEILFNASSGDFSVESEIYEISEETINTLALLLMHIAAGELAPFVTQGLSVWAGEDEDKLQFNIKLAEHIEYLNSQVINFNKKDKNVAVSASDVFNTIRHSE